jgi:hypothetical protein
MDRSDPYYDSLVSYAIPSRPGKRYSQYSPDDLGPPGTNAASIEILHLDRVDMWMMEVTVDVVKRMGDVPEAYDAHGEFIVWEYEEVLKTREDVVRGIPKTYKAVLAKAKKYDGELLRTDRKNPRRRKNRLPGATGSPPFYRDFRGQTFELYLWEPAERKGFLERWEDDLLQRGHRAHLVRSGSDWALYWKRAESKGRRVAANPRRRR